MVARSAGAPRSRSPLGGAPLHDALEARSVAPPGARTRWRRGGCRAAPCKPRQIALTPTHLGYISIRSMLISPRRSARREVCCEIQGAGVQNARNRASALPHSGHKRLGGAYVPKPVPVEAILGVKHPTGTCDPAARTTSVSGRLATILAGICVMSWPGDSARLLCDRQRHRYRAVHARGPLSRAGRVRESERRQYSHAVAAAVRNTAGHAPMSSPSRCERANASRPTTLSRIAVWRPSRCSQIAMQASPQTARTTPPSARDPDATATAKPPINPIAAIGAVGAFLTPSLLRG